MKSNRLFDLSGSPCYPSPLDRLRTGKRERAAQFGLCDENEESFECNQSFPRAAAASSKHHHHNLTPEPGFLNHSDLNPVYLKGDFMKNAPNLKVKSNIQNLKTFRLNCLLNDTSMNNHNGSCYAGGNASTCAASSAEKSWIFYNHFANATSGLDGHSQPSDGDQIISISNPNKALITINGRTSEILTANNISCDLFGYNENQLIGMKLTDLFDVSELTGESQKRPQDLLMESDKLDKNGRVVLCPGKIFDAITVDQTKPYLKNIDENASSGAMDDDEDEDEEQQQQAGEGADEQNKKLKNKLIMPVSMYMLKLTDEKEPKCLCVIEPVQRVVGKFSINLKGRIRVYDSNFSYIFGYTSQSAGEQTATGPSSLSKMAVTSILSGKDINTLIPSMKLPLSSISQEIRKQTLTGRTCYGENIPLSVTIVNKQLFNNEEIVYNCTASIYTNISGLVTVRPSDYKINSYNPTFARLLFGFGDKELIDKPITALIPNFFDPDLNTTAFNSHSRYVTPMSHSMLNAMGSTEHGGANGSFRAKKMNNMHGSFLENTGNRLSMGPTLASSKRVSISVTPLKKTPRPAAPHVYVIDTEKGSQQELAKAVDFDQDQTETGRPSRPCVSCGAKFEQPATAVVDGDEPGKTESEIINNFDLKILDYSPTKKCAQFIEENNFSMAVGSAANTPEHQYMQISSAKKPGSLLVKAIANNKNANDRANISMDEMSIASSSSSSVASQATMSPSSGAGSQAKMSSYLSASTLSHVNVSEFDSETKSSQQMCESCRTAAAAKSTLVGNIKFEEACDENKIAGNPHPETNEVSLINMTAEECADDEHHQYEYGDLSHCGGGGSVAGKRKMSADCEDVLGGDGENRRPSILQSNLTTLNENEEAETGAEKSKKFKNQVTSTPAASKNKDVLSKMGVININTNVDSPRLGKPSPTESIDGLFFGRGRHNDGSLIRIFYQRKLVRTSNEGSESDQQAASKRSDKDNQLICVWISRDPYSDKSMLEYSMDQSQLKSNRHFNQTMNENSNYLNEYEDIRTFGRGASGFVQLARRKADHFQVVTKYILKSKIYKDNWIDDDRYGNIPLEISILCKLDHKNIIKVLEVFQDPEHVQMVMEKHGCGMDLFEFIDRQQKYIDEKLASYIFRQLISAVSYLHANSIVHRDIKDENVVINEKFHIKLIDFGSAAYVHKGKQFATFCGTMDYCAPEVLLGNKYFGPEVDVWTCGITLYTLIFAENPFSDAEETIECIFKPPFKVSKELTKLLFSILCPKPENRMTIEEIEAYSWVTQEVNIDDYKWENVIRNTEFHSNDAGDCRGDDMLPVEPPASKAVESNKQPLGQLDLNKYESEQQTKSGLLQDEHSECHQEKQNFLQVNQFGSEFAGFLSKSF